MAPLKRRKQSAEPMRHPISSKQFYELLAAAGDDPVARELKQIATVVFYTGIRPRELKKLTWADIDLERRCM